MKEQVENKELLHSLCRWEKGLEKIEQCLAEGADINALDILGHTPLYYACERNKEWLVKYLLDKEALPNKAAFDTHAPLVVSAFNNYIKIVSLLLNDKRTDINVRGDDNGTAFFSAIQAGNTELAELLFTKGADPTICIIEYHTSALHQAIAGGHNILLEKILKARPELVNSDTILLQNNCSLLRFAAQMDNLEAVKILLQLGAKVNATYKNKTSALYVAAAFGHDKIAKILLENKADYETLGPLDSNDQLMTPLEIAAKSAHLHCVSLLLNYPHSLENLRKSLNYTMVDMFDTIDASKRARLHLISELIGLVLAFNYPSPKILSLQDSDLISWERAFGYLFCQEPSSQDKKPYDENSAIRYALATIYQLLRDFNACKPYLQFLNEELAYHWKLENNDEAFPKFDATQVEIWSHDSMEWPIPKENFIGLKKSSLLERLLLDKFKQYDMGAEQSKWTGFIPKNKSRAMLLNNAFFTENRRTISGLFHGNIHNLQRVILLLALEEGRIPSSYQQADGKLKMVEFKEIFSAFMRRDLSTDRKPLWTSVLDSFKYPFVTASHPQRLHSLLLSSKEFSGIIQDYLRYNFCTQFNNTRALHNWAYKLNYDNKAFCHELSKLQLHVFGGVHEFAIQMEENGKQINAVQTIDQLQEGKRGPGRQWHIQPKSYRSLREPVKKYTKSLFFSNGGEKQGAMEVKDSLFKI